MSYEQTAIQAFEMIERWMRGLGSASNHRDAADRAMSESFLTAVDVHRLTRCATQPGSPEAVLLRTGTSVHPHIFMGFWRGWSLI